MKINNYYDLERSKQHVEQGLHRTCIGGHWETLGKLPYEFLLKKGLTPEHRLIDIGCGCLRVGIHLVKFLNPGHYFGSDISIDLLDAGYNTELQIEGLSYKLPRKNLICDENFNFSRFRETFDLALAQSVFTHLPLNHLRLCLYNLSYSMKQGGVFYATLFLAKDKGEWAAPLHHESAGITTFPANDPYHYTARDIELAASDLPWEFELIGNWGHPRDQKMVAFHKTN